MSRIIEVGAGVVLKFLIDAVFQYPNRKIKQKVRSFERRVGRSHLDTETCGQDPSTWPVVSLPVIRRERILFVGGTASLCPGVQSSGPSERWSTLTVL